MFRGVFFYEGSSEDFLYLFFSLLFRYICSYIVIANLVLIIDIYIEVVITFSPISLCVVSFLSLQ